MTSSKNCSGCFLIASPYLTDGHFFRAAVLIIRHESEGAFGVVINRPSGKRFREVIAMSDPSWTKSAEGGSAGGSHSGLGNDSPPEEPSADNGASPGQPPPARDQIYSGGPVKGPLLVLHNVAGIGEPCGVVENTEVELPPLPTAPPSDAPPSSDAPPPVEPTGEISGMSATWHDHPAEPFGSLEIQWSDVPAWVTADEDHMRVLARREDAKLKFVVDYAGWGPGQLDQELEAGGWLVLPADAESIFAADDSLWQRLVHRCGREIMDQLTPELRDRGRGKPFDAGLN